MKSLLKWIGAVAGALVTVLLFLVLNQISKKTAAPLPPGVVGITHIDSGTDYVFRTTQSGIGGACQGWNTVSIQAPGEDSTGVTNLMCWQERDGMLHTATVKAESPDAWPMKTITTRAPAAHASQAPVKISNPAPDTTVFGVIHMGMPLSLPTCSARDNENPCMLLSSGAEINIPALNNINSFTYLPVVTVRQIDGAVHDVTVKSQENYSAPDDALADLIEKYGRPTTTIERGNYARWDFDDLHVTWVGRTPDSRHATVFFRTPTGERASTVDYELKNARIPKL